VAAFDHPASRLLARLSSQFFGFFATGTNMGGKTERLQEGTPLIIIVAFIQTHPLRILLARLGAFHYDTVEGSPRQLHVVPISPFHRQS
jgi:hypothetical protein